MVSRNIKIDPRKESKDIPYFYTYRMHDL